MPTLTREDIANLTNLLGITGAQSTYGTPEDLTPGPSSTAALTALLGGSNPSTRVDPGAVAPPTTSYDFGGGRTGSFQGISQGTAETPYEREQTAMANTARQQDLANAEKGRQALNDLFLPGGAQDIANRESARKQAEAAVGPTIQGQTQRDIEQGRIQSEQYKADQAVEAARIKAQADADKANKLPPSVQNRAYLASAARNGLSRISQQVDELDQAGMLGPMMGRWNEFMAGRVGMIPGITPAMESKLAALRLNMLEARKSLASLTSGARGAGSSQMMAQYESVLNSDRMDKNLLKGALASADQWASDYENPALHTPESAASEFPGEYGGTAGSPLAGGTAPPASGGGKVYDYILGRGLVERR